MAHCYSDNEEFSGSFEKNNNIAWKKNGHAKCETPKNTQKGFVNTVLTTGIAITSVLYSLYTTTLLVWFLSGNANGVLKQKYSWSDLSFLEAIIQNVCLILLFITQHRVMSKHDFKRFLSTLLPEHFQRSIYILSTGFVIQCLTSCWINAVDNSAVILWDSSDSNTVCLLCQWLHFFSWMYTFFIVLTMDFSEFVGLKQIYFHANGFGCPMSAKKSAARRFFTHFRHPTCIGLVIIFWIVPCMTLDRLILSSAFTMYLFSTDFDHDDAQYVQEMYKKKRRALSA